MRSIPVVRIVRAVLAVSLLAAGLAIASVAAPAPPAIAALAADPSQSIAGGAFHQCAVRADQTVACWGGNEFGQLGNNSLSDSTTPQPVSGLSAVVAIDAMLNTTCALSSDGTVACWGSNEDGKLGTGSALPFSAVPVSPIGITDAVAVSVGALHACALNADGTVACWGANGFGQLGNGATTGSNVPVSVQPLLDAESISAGDVATCAVRRTGALSCWGRNLPGDVDETRPTDIPQAGNVRSVSVGYGATCVITIDDAGMCTGNGPLGDGSEESSGDFVEVALGAVLDIDVGSSTCAIAPDTSVYCWAAGQSSVLFASITATQAILPERISGLDGVVALDVTAAHACALSSDAIVRCWGTNIDGQLQFEPTGRLTAGFTFPGGSATDVAAGLSTCAALVDGSVTCAGARSVAELNGDLGTLAAAPVPGLSDVVDVSVGFFHRCARTTLGTAWCWGLNAAGEIGIAPDPDVPIQERIVPPTQVAGLSGVEGIVAGGTFSCASTGSEAFCWGSDANGELGNDAAFVNSSSPVQVQTSPTTTTVDMLDAGTQHACARVVNAISAFVACWGQNDNGQLGDGTAINRPTLVVPGILAPAAIATGNGHTCAVDGNVAVWCWGDNSEGQLGLGNTTDQLSKQQLPPFPGAPIALAAGSSHTCALLATGSVYCWGDNRSREVGQPSGDRYTVPVEVPGVNNAVQISASFSTTCARLLDMSVTCWGNNAFGQAGAVPFRFEPIAIDPGGAMLVQPGPEAAPLFTPIEPARLLETRDGQPTIDGDSAGGGTIAGDDEVEIQVAGRAGIPADADFAVLNITAVQPASNGFLTAHSCVAPRPVTASLNYSNPTGIGAINLGNESVVELSASGTVCVYTSASTDLTIDATAFGTTRGGFKSVTPSRILDSRDGEATTDGLFELSAAVAGGSEVELQVRGRAGVPPTANAAVLYIAAVSPTGVGFVTAHPCVADRPLASSLNFATLPDGQRVNRGNEVIAPLDDDGKVCLFVSTTSHLTVDVVGSIDPATTYDVETPARLLETRPGQSTVDGLFELAAPLADGEEVELVVAGRAGVASDASAAVLNITAVNPSGIGFVTAHPCGTTRPTVSSLNFTATAAAGAINGGNEVLAPLSVDGAVCLFVSQSTHLTVDVVGST